MSYYIDIIDTTSPLTRIVPELASGNGIELSWNGGDKKEELFIVGSEFNFDMLDPTYQDAAFVAFYTGNETKWKVRILNAADDAIIWQGFILPDLYSEPYKNGNLFVNFTATDGLGRLKGKYLPDEFYSREKSLIAIFSECLRLTGLELELYFAPAIENYLVKNWNLIYVDTENFKEKEKKKDAYVILETLLQDTLCLCFQCDNRWYIEGINMRHLRKITYKTYDTVGNFMATVVMDRLLKKITPLETPVVTIIPPYNEIVVIHKKTAPDLPKTASTEVNDGWAVSSSSILGEIYPTDWMSNGGYYARCVAPNYNTAIFNEFYFDGNSATEWTQDDTKFVSLRKKLYFAKDDKVKFELSFDVVHPVTGTKGTVETWNDVFKYEIVFNGSVLFSNVSTGGGDVVEDREKLIFTDGGNCKIEIEHVFQAEGLLDIKLYRPIGRVAVNGVLGVKLSSATVEIIGFKEEVIETDLINDDFTVDAEKELEYAEDKTGFSKGFRLAKLKEDTSSYTETEVLILYGFIFDRKNYNVVQLDGANLIADNRYSVYYSGNLIPVLNVFYNFNGGEQMVVETAEAYGSGSFVVRKYAVADVIASRAHWTQWADAFYKIENVSYLKTVANIYRRMFNVAHEKLDVTALNAVKFNDLVVFHYQFKKDFVVLNATWNLDSNKTTLTLARANYKDSIGSIPDGQNIPPIVVAGDDVYINDGVTEVSLLATAYDPDGTIDDQEWTKLSGAAGDTITTPAQLATTITGLTGDNYTYQIEVTDNSGATATDTINVIRTKTYTVTLDLVSEVTNPNKPKMIKQIYKLNVSPDLLPDYALTFSGEVNLYARGGARYGIGITATAWYNLEKNGILIEGKTVVSEWPYEKNIDEKIVPVGFNYISTDVIYVTLFVSKDGPKNDLYDQFKALANFELQSVSIASGVGAIVGLPIEKEIKILKDE